MFYTHATIWWPVIQNYQPLYLCKKKVNVQLCCSLFSWHTEPYHCYYFSGFDLCLFSRLQILVVSTIMFTALPCILDLSTSSIIKHFHLHLQPSLLPDKCLSIMTWKCLHLYYCLYLWEMIPGQFLVMFLEKGHFFFI